LKYFKAMTKSYSLLIAIGFALFAVAAKCRLIPMESNFAVFGALSLFCGAYLRGWAAWLIPLVGFVVSDIVGQRLSIAGVYFYDPLAMALNYVALASMIGVGHLLRRWDNPATAAGTAVSGSLVFFLISNFGSWLDPRLAYDRSWSGLVHCYEMAVPFFKYTLASDVLFFGLMYTTYHWSMAAKDSTAPRQSRSA
jgi:hypothetical protein